MEVCGSVRKQRGARLRGGDKYWRAFVGATTSLAATTVTAGYYSYGANRPVGLISAYAGVVGSVAPGITIGTDTDLNQSGDTLIVSAWGE